MNEELGIDAILVNEFKSGPNHMEPNHRPVISVEVIGRYNKTNMGARLTLLLHPESAGELIVGLQQGLVSLALEER